MNADQADACMMFSKLIPTDKYNKYPLVQERMMAVMNENHPLALKSSMMVEELNSQELVLIAKRDEPFFNEFISEEFEKKKITAKIRAYGVWISAIKAVVKQSNCISLLPSQVAQSIQGDGVVCRKVEGLPDFYFSLITKCDGTKKNVLDFIRYVKI